MTANISDSNESANSFPPMYAPRTLQSSRHDSFSKNPLYNGAMCSMWNIGLILANNNKHAMLLMSMMTHIKFRKRSEDRPTVLDCIVIDLPVDWYVGLSSRNTLGQTLKDMADLNIIKKHSKMKHCRKYYINPEIAHSMSISQRFEYVNQYADFIGRLLL